MLKLSDIQLNVLFSAARHEAGLAARPDGMKSAAAARIAANLMQAKLVREVSAKADWPIWRKDSDGKAYSLKILKAGQTATEEYASQREEPFADTPVIALQPFAPAPRRASKIGGIVGLLESADGATSDQMTSATGWLPHTLRAALTGLRKRGYAIQRWKTEAGTTYRIVPAPSAAAA